MANLTEQEEREFNRLLSKIGEGNPTGFIPKGSLELFFDLMRTPFLELIIYRRHAGEIEYLYQNRHDEIWEGLCAYGGMVRRNSPNGPIEIAQQLIDREFEECGLRIKSLRVVTFLGWPEHDWQKGKRWCRPFIVPCLIEIGGDIPNREDMVWLQVNNLPKNIIPNHTLYLHQCEQLLRTDRPLVFTPEHPDGISPRDPGDWPLTPFENA